MSLNVSSCGRCLNGKSNTTKFTLFSSAQRIAFDVNRLESTPPSRPVEAWEGISTLPRTVLRQILLFNKLSRKLTLQWISQLLKSKKARSLSYLKLYEGSIRDMQSPRYRGISTTKKGIQYNISQPNNHNNETIAQGTVVLIFAVDWRNWRKILPRKRAFFVARDKRCWTSLLVKLFTRNGPLSSLWTAYIAHWLLTGAAAGVLRSQLSTSTTFVFLQFWSLKGDYTFKTFIFFLQNLPEIFHQTLHSIMITI